MSERGQDFAARLRQVMADLNLSRLTLARELGVDKSVIGRWLAGVNQPTDHNLTRLTGIIRRRHPDVTLDFWQGPSTSLSGAAPRAHSASEGPVVSGLRAEQRPEIDANYLGLWAGFYQSTQNRGSVVLALMHIWDSEVGLRCVFTEGKVSASGAAIAIGSRLHAILEIEPMHDRLCLFIFNGVGSPDAVVMDGIYMISAGDAAACAAASPVVLFRIGDSADFARSGGLEGMMQSLYPVNARNIQESVLARDPVAGLADLLPEQVLRLVCAQVGVARADGEMDHVLRMPASRSLPSGSFGLAELPANSPMVMTCKSLRRMLGLDQVAEAEA
jgi:transcriptional regulator with XRE-family HTH domain